MEIFNIRKIQTLTFLKNVFRLSLTKCLAYLTIIAFLLCMEDPKNAYLVVQLLFIKNMRILNIMSFLESLTWTGLMILINWPLKMCSHFSITNSLTQSSSLELTSNIFPNNFLMIYLRVWAIIQFANKNLHKLTTFSLKQDLCYLNWSRMKHVRIFM